MGSNQGNPQVLDKPIQKLNKINNLFRALFKAFSELFKPMTFSIKARLNLSYCYAPAYPSTWHISTIQT